jgi:hypothetical protein
VVELREDLRAADADRQFVADLLRTALNEGRLRLSEYDDRLKEAYAAKTYGDLDRLLGDLPTVVEQAHSQVAPAKDVSDTTAPRPVPQAAPPAQPGYRVSAPEPPRRGRMARFLSGVWSAWLIAVFVNVAIWTLVSFSVGHAVYFWPMWVGGPWGAVLIAMSISGIARGEHNSHEAYAERGQRRQARYERRQARYKRRVRRYQER